jgi:hypothetical protein
MPAGPAAFPAQSRRLLFNAGSREADRDRRELDLGAADAAPGIRRGPYALGAIFAAIAFLGPLWNVIIGACQLSLIPERLLGRVMSVDFLLTCGAVPVPARSPRRSPARRE